MEMKKSFLCLLSSFLLLAFLLTGCSEEADTENPTSPTVAVEAPKATAGTEKPTAERPSPTEKALSPTPLPEQEIVASTPKRTILCEVGFFMARREDGTVAVLGMLPDESREMLNQWKNIASLCDYWDSPAALTKGGSLVIAERVLEEEAAVFGVESIVWASLDGASDFIAIDRDGALFEITKGYGTLVTEDAAAVQTAGYLFLDCYGKLHPLREQWNKTYEEKEMAEWESCVCIAYSGRSGDFYAARADGTVQTSSYIKAIQDWTGLVSIAADGGMVVGLKKDGTVVAHTSGPGEKAYGNYAVETWQNVVEVTTNGYYTVGRTSDGRLLCTEIPPEAGVSFTKEDVEGILLR